MAEILATERRIKSTGRGGDHLGKCDQCGKPCGEHYAQQWRRQYRLTSGTRVGQEGWTAWEMAGFGHAACLRTGAYADAPVIECDTARNN